MRFMSIAVFMVGGAFASNAVAEGCEDVILFSKLSSSAVKTKSSIEANAANFCNEYQQAKTYGRTMAASASYKFLSASYGSSNASTEEVASKFCSATSLNNVNNEAYKEYVETISPEAYTSYQQCKRMENKSNIIFDLNPVDMSPKQLSMTVKYQAGMGGATPILKYVTTKGVTCSWLDTTNKTFTFNADIGATDLTCTREDTLNNSSVKIVSTKSNDVISFKWPAFTSDGVTVDAMKDLLQKNKKLEERLNVLESKESSMQNSVVSFNSSDCPQGWVPYTPAYGLFIRGINLNEPDNVRRKPGTEQADTFKHHHHHGGYPAHMPSRYGIEVGTPSPSGTRWAFSDSAGAVGFTGAANTNEVGDDETRPKNVALLFCTKAL